MNRSRDPKHYFQKKTPHREPAFPLATIAYYGPDDRTASKVVVSIQFSDGDVQPLQMQWLSDGMDARQDPAINHEILAALGEHGVVKMALIDGVAHFTDTAAHDDTLENT